MRDNYVTKIQKIASEFWKSLFKLCGTNQYEFCMSSKNGWKNLREPIEFIGTCSYGTLRWNNGLGIGGFILYDFLITNEIIGA